jgi:hypothetical protein
MNRQQTAFVETFSKELANENVALFAGAGLSIPAGFVNWKELLHDIAAEIGLDVDLETDLVAVAQFHFNERQNRSALNRALIEHFSQGHHATENHSILARLPIKTYWTTNYDNLIENALRTARRLPDVKHAVSQLKTTLPQRDAVVYKMHGDASQPDEAVLIKDDYERYSDSRGPFATALSGDLIEKCFLFVGFSFSDPNLEYILSRIRQSLKEKPRDHFCMFKTVERSDFKSDQEFTYSKIRQELATKDLRRFGIQTVFVETYSEITELLRAIENRHKQRTVFISGSAASYGHHSDGDAQNFIKHLSQALICNKNRIVSGFGVGIGSFVISGALEEIYQNQGKQLHDQLILRPFPQGENEKTQYEIYRKEMIAYAGIAIFIFGNKAVGGQIENAGGIRHEFELAKASGLSLIPVGATGFMAQELWTEVTKNIEEYYPGREDVRVSLEKIGPGKDANSVVSEIVNLLRLIKG